jgi:hypothetical protein
VVKCRYGSIAGLSIGGSLLGTGQNSGWVLSDADLGAMTVAGTIQGGSGNNSGLVQCLAGTITLLQVGGEVAGGAGADSGEVSSGGDLGTIAIGGSLLGGSGPTTGCLVSAGDISQVTIGGSVVGTESSSGLILAGRTLAKVLIVHDLVGGSGSGAAPADSAGYLQGKRIGQVMVGGSIIAGLPTMNGTPTRSGSIRAQLDLGSLTVKGSLLGNSNNPVVISARSQPVPTASVDVAIHSVTIGGNVDHANILAGYDEDGNPVDGGAQIGQVVVYRDWIASNLAAGVSAGHDQLFGTADDVKISAGSTNIIAKIGHIRIGGQVEGTANPPNPADHYGFVSEWIGDISVGGISYRLHAGPHNDRLRFGQRTDWDVTLLEV